MSVYTLLQQQDIISYLEQMNLGQLRQFQGITAGVTNSNYFVETSQGQFVLILFEQHAASEVEFYVTVMKYLQEQAMPCPKIYSDKAAKVWRLFKGKPSILIEFIVGQPIFSPSFEQLVAAMQSLAQLHLTLQALNAHRDNPNDLAWMIATFTALQAKISEEECELISGELALQKQQDFSMCPRGIIHADYFQDNVLFRGNEVVAVLDFDFCCTDAYIYDVAIAVTAWCVDSDNMFDASLMQLAVAAYQQQRPLVPLEQSLWPVALRRAALRFYLSRLRDFYTHQPDSLIQIKDPNVMAELLVYYQYAALDL